MFDRDCQLYRAVKEMLDFDKFEDIRDMYISHNLTKKVSDDEILAERFIKQKINALEFVKDLRSEEVMREIIWLMHVKRRDIFNRERKEED